MDRRYPTTPDKCKEHRPKGKLCALCAQQLCTECGACGCDAVEVIENIVVETLIDTVKKRTQTMESNGDKDPDDIADSGNNFTGS